MAIPLGAAAGVVALEWWAHRPITLPRRQQIEVRAPGDARVDAPSAAPWIVVVALIIGWELFSYFSGPRAAHPTLSSLEDSAAQWHAAKAAVFAGWLALGWFLVRR